MAFLYFHILSNHFIPHRIHGAGIYANMTGVFLDGIHVTIYSIITWIRHGKDFPPPPVVFPVKRSPSPVDRLRGARWTRARPRARRPPRWRCGARRRAARARRSTSSSSWCLGWMDLLIIVGYINIFFCQGIEYRIFNIFIYTYI